MFQQFFTKTIESKFIKNLLYNTPLPIYKLVTEGDYIFNNSIYIYRNWIIKCTQTGYLNSDTVYYWTKSNLIVDSKLVDNISITNFTINYGTSCSLDSNYNVVIDDLITTTIQPETTKEELDWLVDKYILVGGVGGVYQVNGIISKSDTELLIDARNMYCGPGLVEDTVSSTDYSEYPENNRLKNYWYTFASQTPKADFVVISYYEFGEDYPGYTEHFISDFGYYDSETHEKLGKYLRCIKNIYDIDLMPFYNCYSNKIANNFYIRGSREDELYARITIPAKDSEDWYYDEELDAYYIIQDYSKNNYGIPAGLLYYLKQESNIKACKINDENEKQVLIYVDERPDEEYYIELAHKLAVYTLLNEPNTDFKVVQIPILYNTTYTIALDTDAEILLKPAIIKNERFVEVFNDAKTRIDLTEALGQKVIVKEGSKFRAPFTYRLDLDLSNSEIELLEANERNLYLLIQLPINFTTSLVVLEGDYSDNSKYNNYFDCSEDTSGLGTTKYQSYYDHQYVISDDLTDGDLNSIFISALSLLKLNDQNNYAFSNRLIDYLLLNVINPLDQIDKNLIRANIKEYNLLWDNISNNISRTWSNQLREYFYRQIITNNKIEHYDFNGFIDKDTDKQCLNYTKEEEE